ncbi:YebC/PmpR family DNA-binding transcriptional regulator, partial [candidate division NPL-UPA2 bacterium]|nr:YebC/PmpR family DNA-binding transcriptional regulator [candidate division NPL-UPA2 bacterium]
MSGHSKWAGIKHKKALVDSRRGKLFSKLVREITVAAKQGGGSLETNPRLRTAIQAAKDANMPAEKMERAIKKGTGELPGTHYEEMIMEGYGPGGVAVMLEIMTDNRNRTASEIKHLFSKGGGHLGESGCVAWLFHKKGLITVSENKSSEDKLLEISLEAGAEDLKKDGDAFAITSTVDNFPKVKEAIAKANIEYNLAEITELPRNTVRVEGKTAEQALRLVETLE